MRNKRIKIRKTEGEFSAIDRRVRELGKPDLNAYLRSEIYKLEKEIDRCPECITEGTGDEKKKERAHYISIETYAQLLKLKRRMRKPISSIIDDFIILPLLTGKTSAIQHQP